MSEQTFQEWVDEFNRVSGWDHKITTEDNAWEDYWKDGYTPKEAIKEDHENGF